MGSQEASNTKIKTPNQELFCAEAHVQEVSYGVGGKTLQIPGVKTLPFCTLSYGSEDRPPPWQGRITVEP